jgi:Zn-dependent alcohol dehydrogenase
MFPRWSIFAALIASSALRSYAQAVFGDWSYVITNGNAAIVVYRGGVGSAVIPNAIEGKPVTIVGVGTNVDPTAKITDLVMPDGVVSIGPRAFENATNLTSLTLGSNVEMIGRAAFAGAGKLTN